jgi:hypothetical protein
VANALGTNRGVGLALPPRARTRTRTSARRDAATPSRPAADLWPFSALAAVIGLGLVAVAIGDVLGRHGSKWAQPLFWAGMALLWVPAILRIIGREASRGERIALLVLLGMGMYVVKILYSPRYFVGHDEFLHWRTAEDIVRTDRLFELNPLLPVSPLFPGMEIATSAVAKLTGLSVFLSGTLVIGAARLILIVGLYLLYETVIGSSWLAGVATAVYFTNPQFLFFDGSYAYESLALSLAVVVLYTVLRGSEGRERYTPRAALLVSLPLAATVVTHHITSFALATSLLLLAAIALAFRPIKSHLWHWGIALIGGGFVLMWLFLVGGPVIDYLRPQVVGGVSQLIDLIRGEGPSRHLFQSYVGQSTPPFDRAASFAFPAIILLALPLGWLQIWRTGRIRAFSGLFVVCSLAYPVSGLFRFTSVGLEVGERLSAVVFVPVSYCVAMAIASREEIKASRAWTVALACLAALLLYGGIAIGTPYWARLPGPYLVSAESRSIEPEGIAAASWAEEFLGPGNRIGADRINQLLMLTHGEQQPVTRLADLVDPTPVFFSPRFTSFDSRLLRRGALDYLVVDYRLTRGLPWLGVYYDDSEPGGLHHKRPIPTAAFAKFDRAAHVSRVFDSGDIAIFDVRRVAGRG